MAELNVDGQRFKVTERSDRPGAYDFECLAGPHAGRGFTSSSSDGSRMTCAELEADAREYLAARDYDPD